MLYRRFDRVAVMKLWIKGLLLNASSGLKLLARIFGAYLPFRQHRQQCIAVSFFFFFPCITVSE
jgi:hypothetical protein